MLLTGRAAAQGTPIGFEETFALAADRAQALEQLVPGSPQHYFYSCLQAQHEGNFARADELLEAWRQRHGRGGNEQERIETRQALLKYRQDPEGTASYFVRRYGLRFDQSPVLPGATTDLPTKLDQALITSQVWSATIFGRNARSLNSVEDRFLPRITERDLSDEQVTEVLRRLHRPDVPGLVGLVVRELGFKKSGGFGSLQVHGLLLLEQLEELLSARPELLNDGRFVEVYLRRLAPNPDEDADSPEVRAAHLTRLERFSARLGSAFDALRAHVGFHRLSLDLERGNLDIERLLAYLRTARQRDYADPALLRNKEAVELGTAWATGLARVVDDTPVVLEYLQRLFQAGAAPERFIGTLRRELVNRVYAETKILAGDPDSERWYSLLNDSGYYEELKNRVELEFPRGQRLQYAPDEAVKIELDVKNVSTLIVKIFEVDTLGVYEGRSKGGRIREIDASLDLDGLVAHEELNFQYGDSPLRRVRRTFEFPGLQGAGVWVIEFIGNGVSSRAVIRKGTLSALERVGAAGHVFQVLDHTGALVKDAALRFGGREFTADERGEIVVPFTSDPGRRQVILRRGDFGVLDEFDHRAENYRLEAAIYVDRETLLAGNNAEIIVRPRLTVAGERARLSLLEGASLEVIATDLDGVTTSSIQRDLQLADEREFVHELRVPPRTTSLTVTLRGKIHSLSANVDVELAAATQQFSFNGIDATDEVVSPLLERTANGYVLEVRGKNGEPIVGRVLSLEFKHRDFRSTRNASLQTDVNGRVELGYLADIERIQASGAGGDSVTWNLGDPLRSGAPNQVHVLAGEAVRVPYEGTVRPLGRADVSLLELRNGEPAFDRFSAVGLDSGYVVAEGLTPGDYRLELVETGQVYTVRVTAAERAGARTYGGARRLELSQPLDLQIVGTRVQDEVLTVQLAGVGPATRVHVIATRYLPPFEPHHRLALPRRSSLAVEQVVDLDCEYEAGRRISDEYRYILDRRLATRFPGNMLARAGLLLNPWAVDESTMDTLAGAGDSGGRYRGPSDTRPGRAASRAEAASHEAGGRPQAFANLDALATPSSVVLNLVPDANGVVRVPLEALGDRTYIRIVAVDDEVTVSRTMVGAEKPFPARERRLTSTLDPEKHFVEDRRIEFVDAGASITFRDAANADVETFDSLDDVYRHFATKSGDAELEKFEFLVRWPELSADEKLERYSVFACHELHVFLREKDPEFFRVVVAPYLANKAEKTFLDHWLLGADLARYFEPWSFAQLNTFERILLLRGADGDAVRHVRELVELLPPEQFSLGTYFDSVMASSALDADMPALTAAVERLRADRSRKDLEQLEARDEVAAMRPSAPASRGGEPPTASDDVSLSAGLETANKEGREILQLGFEDKELDAGRRRRQRGFFQALADTAELAERNYWRVRIASHTADLVTPTPFWQDFAEVQPGAPFLSPRFPLATRSVNEMLLALALLDLPFESAEHTTQVEGQGLVFQAGSRLLMARKGLVEVQSANADSSILIGQDFYRLDEPFAFDNGRQRDKLITGEFLKGVPYGCRVVVTNPTSTPIDVEVLLQIPEGTIPVRRGFTMRGQQVSLAGYGSSSLEYAFYFPKAGDYRHYPAHVGEDGELLAFAPASVFDVVNAPTTIDTTSWEHISQAAELDAVIAYMEANNLARLDLSRLAWRMKDRAAFERTLALLKRNVRFDATVWSFGLMHKDERAIREYLEQRMDLVVQAGPWLESPLLTVHPVERHLIEHLEYEPLVNGRVHRFGTERRILNSSFAAQYVSFLSVLAFKPQLDAEDRLALTYYLSLQDRVEEALATFAAVDAAGLESRLQYDYMQAYLAFYSPTPEDARAIAATYTEHPVQRWRARFRDVIAQLDEAQGRGLTGVQDPDSRDQRQGALAASEPALELKVEAQRVSLTYANLGQVEVRYRPMDIELLFSTNPFLASGGSSFGSIKPNRVDTVDLPSGVDTFSFELPTEFRGTNVLVEVRGAGIVRSQAYYANDLRVQGLENYGQVLVRRASEGTPCPAAYVKVYARLAGGEVRFHKDGYTDLRGRFDYVSLSGMDGAEIERFAVLVMDDARGALVREFAPPQK